MGLGEKGSPGLAKVRCTRFKDGAFADFEDLVSPEHEVALHWPDRDPVRLWAFPHQLEELALGHALLELCAPGQVPAIQWARDGVYHMVPLEDARSDAPPSEHSLTPEFVVKAMREFMARPGYWEDTGCFHRMAALDPGSGEFLHVVEDIGRHNCVDRMAGWALLHGWNPSALVLCVSARATASLMRKIMRAGFSCVISRSAVTTAAMAMAAGARMTLAGFARPGRFTVFVHKSRTLRIVGADADHAVLETREGTA